jgi:hypothetical protein
VNKKLRDAGWPSKARANLRACPMKCERSELPDRSLDRFSVRETTREKMSTVTSQHEHHACPRSLGKSAGGTSAD